MFEALRILLILAGFIAVIVGIVFIVRALTLQKAIRWRTPWARR